jgi:hypothetical protein
MNGGYMLGVIRTVLQNVVAALSAIVLALILLASTPTFQLYRIYEWRTIVLDT